MREVSVFEALFRNLLPKNISAQILFFSTNEKLSWIDVNKGLRCLALENGLIDCKLVYIINEINEKLQQLGGAAQSLKIDLKHIKDASKLCGAWAIFLMKQYRVLLDKVNMYITMHSQDAADAALKDIESLVSKNYLFYKYFSRCHDKEFSEKKLVGFLKSKGRYEALCRLYKDGPNMFTVIFRTTSNTDYEHPSRLVGCVAAPAQYLLVYRHAMIMCLPVGAILGFGIGGVISNSWAAMGIGAACGTIGVPLISILSLLITSGLLKFEHKKLGKIFLEPPVNQANLVDVANISHQEPSERTSLLREEEKLIYVDNGYKQCINPTSIFLEPNGALQELDDSDDQQHTKSSRFCCIC